MDEKWAPLSPRDLLLLETHDVEGMDNDAFLNRIDTDLIRWFDKCWNNDNDANGNEYTRALVDMRMEDWFEWMNLARTVCTYIKLGTPPPCEAFLSSRSRVAFRIIQRDIDACKV